MRTTLTLDDDVAAMLVKVQKKTKSSFKAVVNDALRQGLHQMQSTPLQQRFETKSWDLGPCLVGNLDNIEEVIATVEGEWHK